MDLTKEKEKMSENGKEVWYYHAQICCFCMNAGCWGMFSSSKTPKNVIQEIYINYFLSWEKSHGNCYNIHFSQTSLTQ